MANIKKFSKTRKNSFRNKNKTKNNKSRKSTIFLRKGKNGSKKNKLMKGGEKKVNDFISIDKNKYKCNKPSSYVIELNKVFLEISNIKYRQKIKQIACEFLKKKIQFTKNNSETYINMIDYNFVVFMCYFFDDTENKYINDNQCNPDPIYGNIEEIQNPIYANPNPVDLNETINRSWVDFLNTKLIGENITPIRDIIIKTLKIYIEEKLKNINRLTVVDKIYKIKTLTEDRILSQPNLEIIFGQKNTAIEFILVFCNEHEQNEIKTILIKNLGLDIYAIVNKKNSIL